MTRHNHDFWFSDVRYQFPPTTPVYRGTPTLIIDFTIFYSGFFSSEAFDKRTNRVKNSVADKHARYISEDYTVREVEKVTNELGDNGAHRCADYCFCKRTGHYICREGTPLQKGLPRCLVPLPREWRPTGHVFLAFSMSYSCIMGFALFN